MKKLLSIVLCATSTLAFASDIECGTVGVIQVSSSQQNTVIAAAFGDLTNGNIKVADIVKTTSLSDGDQIFVYKNGAFSGWALSSGAWTNVAANVSLDDSGTVKSATGTAASSETVAYGSGVWLKRASKPSSAFTITIYGKPVSETISVSANTTVLCGNPTTTAKAPTISGMQAGDVIKVPSDATLVTTYRYNGSAWKYASGATVAEGLPTIAAGTGFWYQAASAGNARTISW